MRKMLFMAFNAGLKTNAQAENDRKRCDATPSDSHQCVFRGEIDNKIGTGRKKQMSVRSHSAIFNDMRSEKEDVITVDSKNNSIAHSYIIAALLPEEKVQIRPGDGNGLAFPVKVMQ